MYSPIDPRLKNHKARHGANVNPTLLVPNLCMPNNPTRMTTDTLTNAPVKKKKKSLESKSELKSSPTRISESVAVHVPVPNPSILPSRPLTADMTAINDH